MKIKTIYEAVNALAPFDSCADWDNSGLLVGHPEHEASKVYICLDVTPETAADAAAQGCQLIISHHPVIFGSISSVVDSDYTGAILLQLIEHGIAVISAHTNFDSAERGVNYSLAALLGIKDPARISEDPDDPSFAGSLPQPLSGRELADLVKTRLGIKCLKAAGLDPERRYQHICVCGGAGSGLWPTAKACGAEVLISADSKHNIGLEAAAAGFALIDAGHFHTENPAMRSLFDALSRSCPELELVLSDIDTCPWKDF